MKVFGKTKALIIERFDRLWTKSGKFIRLPQEDICQALAVPSTLKYQSDGGPGAIDIINLLKGSDSPAEDQKNFLKALIFFWLISATDGHAKNFSIFILPGGGYKLTPIYDILTAQPYLDRKEIQKKQVRLAMSVGKNRHYRCDEILPRHFLQTAELAGLPKYIALKAISEILENAQNAFLEIEKQLPVNFPAPIHRSVKKVAQLRLKQLKSEFAKNTSAS